MDTNIFLCVRRVGFCMWLTGIYFNKPPTTIKCQCNDNVPHWAIYRHACFSCGCRYGKLNQSLAIQQQTVFVINAMLFRHFLVVYIRFDEKQGVFLSIKLLEK